MVVIDIVEELDGQTPLEVVHCRTSIPIGIPVIDDVGEVGEVITPVPEINVQLPVPIAGGVAFKFA
jgi:hypothetical protein